MSASRSDVLLFERVDVTCSTTVEGALYGFAFAVYIFCARSLCRQLKDRDQHRQHLFALLYMSLAMILAFLRIVVDAQDIQTSYVDHADYPGGGYFYSRDVYENSSVAFVGDVAAALLSLMMSGIQIWRLWIVWRASRYSGFIVVLPALTFLAFLGLKVVEIALRRVELTPRLNLLFLYGAFVPPLYISITVTVLIVTRIALVHRKNIQIMGQTDTTNPYTSIYSMLIESFALESVWLTVQIFTSPNPTPVAIAVTEFFADTQPFIQLLAYLLVVYQVITGRGWKADTAEKLTTLQWNRDGESTTQTGIRISIPITQERS